MSEGIKTSVMHKHYRYKLYFNDIHVAENMTSCILDDQDEKFRKQLEIGIENLPDGYEQLLFYNETVCISCLTTKDLKRSSEARASRNFMVYKVPLEEMLHGSTDKVFVSPDLIADIFDTHVVSSKIVEETFKEIDQAIEEQADNAQILLATVKTIIYHQQVQAGDKKRVLNYELPYGKWLKDLMEKYYRLGVYSIYDCRLSHGCYELGYGQDRNKYIVKWSVKNCLSFLTRFKVLFTEQKRLKQCTNGVSRRHQ